MARDTTYNFRMKLQQLFAALPGVPEIHESVDVTGLFNDARTVQAGGVFVAIRGGKFDGHDFLADAVKRGAVALVVSDPSKVPAGFTGFTMQTPDPRAVLDVLAARLAGDPAREMFCVGVTGTNGKTSIAYMSEAVLNAGRKPAGVIGTVDHHLGERVWPSGMTTPDPIFLQKRLREFRDAGAEAAVLEVSSHALDQRRADSVPFNAVVFTNLTRDHLDYHPDMEHYFAAKQRLCLDLLWRTTKHPSYAIINVDDPWGRRLRVADTAVLWTYGRDDADFQWTILRREFARTVFKLRTPMGDATVELPMGGDHNVQNATAAFAVGLAAGMSVADVTRALNEFRGVPGRLESVPGAGTLNVFVDYAHSPDALDNVLGSIASIRKNAKLKSKVWTVFGCGGDRDKGKRPLMLRAALRNSDRVVVTSDNPRTEPPDAIIAEILAGAPSREGLTALADRKAAIRFALENAAPGDVVLIAGKGHESEQIIGQEKFRFSDAEVARDLLRELGK